MVKIFICNLAVEGVAVVTKRDLKSVFELYGTVDECEVIKTGYGFVHMPNAINAKKAIRELDGFQVAGKNIKVRISDREPLLNIFVGNLAKRVTEKDLKTLFEVYGTVAECDVRTGYGFVHMPHAEKAQTAIRELNGFTVAGKKIEVKISTRRKTNQSTGIEAGGVKQPCTRTKNENKNWKSDDQISQPESICVDKDFIESSKAIIKKKSSVQTKPIPAQVKAASITEQAENSSSTSELEVKFPIPSQTLSRGSSNELHAMNDPSILTNENKDWNSNNRIGQSKTICIGEDFIESTRAVIKNRKLKETDNYSFIC